MRPLRYSRPPQNFTLNRESAQARGLIGWWPTNNNERDGKVLLDYSGYGRHATVTNDTNYQIIATQNEYGRCLTTNAHSAEPYFQVLGMPAHAKASYVFWVRAHVNTNWGFTGGVTWSGDKRWIDFYSGDPYESTLVLRYGVGNSTSLQNNKWYHVAICHNAGTWLDWSGYARAYVNGILVNSSYATVPISGTFLLGHNIVQGMSRHFDFLDWRVYDHGLSSAEVWNLYNPETRWDLYKPTVYQKFWQGVSLPESRMAIPSNKWNYTTPPNTSFTINKESSQAQNLIGVWNLLGGMSGRRLIDHSDKKHIGTFNHIVNPRIVTDPEFGRVMEFDGTEAEFASCGILQPDILGQFTITVWYKPTSDDFAHTYTGLTGNGSYLVGGIHLGLLGSKIRLIFNTVGSEHVLAGTNDLQVGKWNFIAGTVDGAFMKTYLNGILDNSTANTNLPATTTNEYRVGYGQQGNSSPHGCLGEVRLYNHALTASQIAALYQPSTRWELYKPVEPKRIWQVNLSTPQPHTVLAQPKWNYTTPPSGEFELNTESSLARGLIAWYPMQGNQGGNYLKDYSGRGQHGTFQGSISRVNKMGWGALNGGTNAYVECTDSDALDNIKAVSVWLLFNTANNYHSALWSKCDIPPAFSAGAHFNKSWNDTNDWLYWGNNADMHTGVYANYVWHNIVYTFPTTPTSGATIYVDGVLVATDVGSSPSMSNSSPFRIGFCDWNGSLYLSADNWISDVTVWNRALTPGEAARLYNPSTRWELYQPITPRLIFAIPSSGTDTSSTKSAYLEGTTAGGSVSDSSPAYLQGAYGFEIEWAVLAIPPTSGTSVSDAKSAHLKGQDSLSGNRSAYLRGSIDTACMKTFQDGASGDVNTNYDNYMQSGLPTTNNGSQTHVAIGYSTSEGIYRALLRFNLSSIPSNSDVISAKLTLIYFWEAVTGSITVNIYRQKRNWVDSQSTWNVYSTGNSWATAGGFGADDCEQTEVSSLLIDDTHEAKTWTIDNTSIEEMLSGGSWTNYGYLLKATNEGLTDKVFISSDYPTEVSRPKLVIVYSTEGASKSAYLCGQASTSDSKHAYLNGAAAGTDTSATIKAYMVGGINPSGFFPAFLNGKAEASGLAPAYILAQDYLTSSKLGYLSGKADTNASTQAFLQGAADTSDTVSAYLAGGIAVSDAKSAYIQGYLEGTPTLDHAHAYMVGTAATSATLSAFMSGGLIVSDSTLAYIRGQDYTSTVALAYIRGSASPTASIYAFMGGIDYGEANLQAYIRGLDYGVSSTNAYLSGKQEAQENRGAYLRGQADSTDSRPGYIRGAQEVSDNASAFIQGQASVDASVLAYLTGNAVLSDFRSSYLRGNSSTSSLVSAYTVAWEHTLATVSGYLRGQELATSTRSAYLIGQITTSIPAYLEGIPPAGTGVLFAYLKGLDNTSGSTPAYMRGAYGFEIQWAIVSVPPSLVLSESDSKSAYVQGKIVGFSNQAAYLQGGIICTESKSAYLKGRSDEVSSKEAYARGSNDTSSQLSVYLGAWAHVVVAQSAYLEGTAQQSSASQAAYLRGGVVSGSQIPAYTKGQAETISFAPAYIAGMISSSDTKHAYLNAINPEGVSTKHAFINGYSANISTKSAYLEGRSTYYESISAYLRGSITVPGLVHGYLCGTSSQVSSVAGYTRGSLSVSNSKQAFIQGAEAGSSQSAYIRGSNAAENDKSAYVRGKTATQGTQSAYLEGTSTSQSNKPAYLRGSIPAQESVHAYINGKLSGINSKSAYLVGYNATTGASPAYISGRLEVSGSKTAYLNATSGTISHAHAYIEGTLPGTDYRHAYMFGQIATSIHAYMNGYSLPGLTFLEDTLVDDVVIGDNLIVDHVEVDSTLIETVEIGDYINEEAVIDSYLIDNDGIGDTQNG
jgi:hypothetical protein